VSLTLRRGEFAALVGPNGSGKSTLLRLLLGLLAPKTGEARLFGDDPRSPGERARLGYVPQRTVLTPDLPVTVREVVATGRLARRGWWRRTRAADRAAIDHAIESVGLAAEARRPVLELSGGQQQRVLIARALASEPELLVLDEPVAGVDAESQRLFRDSLVHLVAEHGAAVLLVSHELGAVAADLDRVLVMKRSIKFDGPPAQLEDAGVSLGVHADDLPLWLEAIE
jgi:zinc transport system ATP-binding protein